ncbi:MAG: tyrosine/phenylalanine carboxypeptidase domain-containing protein [Candidatus Gracilibacteria bacterium]|jgi:alpha-L-glutamate ligase-like protein/uncharacterized protein (TIGR02421 family)
MFFSEKGILGINARNLLYIKPFNPKKAIKLADDKIKSKRFLSAREIPVPKLYSIIKTFTELEKFDFNSLPQSFVVKPNQGFGGEGIIPIIGKEKQYWISSDGEKLTKEDLKDHIIDILDGRYSIANVNDSVFFEQLIISDESIGKYAYKGLPDIRIVVHNLIPVMAMLRLPTKESKGRANIHQGAVAVGIDISKGQTTHISYKNKIIEHLPEGLGNLKGLKIPYWDKILLIASKIQLITNLGYLAVDIAIDKNMGPVLLEINARAGLGVQIANLAPLKKRLEKVQDIKVQNPIKAIRVAKDLFGNVVEKEVENLMGKQMIGTEENIEINYQKSKQIILKAKIDTGINRSIIDEEIAEKCGLLDDNESYDDEKSTLKIQFNIKNKRVKTIVDIEKISNPNYKMIIGERDLKDFLINVDAKKEKPKEIKLNKEILSDNNNINFYEIDQQISTIDSKIKLLYHLRPINLNDEITRFLKTPEINPIFQYPKLKFEPIELIEEIKKIKTDESSLGIIFQKKIEEMLLKISLLESIDEPLFTETSKKLFGAPAIEEIATCTERVNNNQLKVFEKNNEKLNTENAKKIFEEAFLKNHLDKWKVKIKETLVSDCVAGKINSLFIKQNAIFSEERLKSLIIHEIETHILTAENGKLQPYSIFNKGLANYLETQEGLAMYNVETQTNSPFEKNLKAHVNVLAINFALNFSFAETYQKLIQMGISSEVAIRSTLKAKRGLINTCEKGAFTKDYIYFKGYYSIKNFINNRGNIKDLYIGKIGINDIETVKNLFGIVSPQNIPEWLK